MARDTYPPIPDTVRLAWEWTVSDGIETRHVFTNMYYRNTAPAGTAPENMIATANSVGNAWLSGSHADRAKCPTTVASVGFHVKDLGNVDNPTFFVPFAVDGTLTQEVYSTGVCAIIQCKGDAGGRPAHWYQRHPYLAESQVTGNAISGTRTGELALLYTDLYAAIGAGVPGNAHVGVAVLLRKADNPVEPNVYMDEGVVNTRAANPTCRTKVGRSVGRLA